jgi:hypothetical protein
MFDGGHARAGIAYHSIENATSGAGTAYPPLNMSLVEHELPPLPLSMPEQELLTIPLNMSPVEQEQPTLH